MTQAPASAVELPGFWTREDLAAAGRLCGPWGSQAHWPPAHAAGPAGQSAAGQPGLDR